MIKDSIPLMALILTMKDDIQKGSDKASEKERGMRKRKLWKNFV